MMWSLVKAFLLFVQVTLQAPVEENVTNSEPTRFSELLNCGFHYTQDQIRGGNDTEIGEFPWMAALEYRNINDNISLGVLCGGSLITKRFVLTAAHCIKDYQKGRQLFEVRLGDWDLATDPDCYDPDDPDECADKAQTIPVDRTILHPNYSKLRKQNDIGLILLQHSSTFTRFVGPICVPVRNKLALPTSNVSLFVAGWGSTGFESSSNVLQKAEVRLIATETCNQLIAEDITSTKLCAGHTSRDACSGDSGGPLIRLYGIYWYLEGVVGSGLGCQPELPGVTIYSRVLPYISWINDTLQNEYQRIVNGSNEDLTQNETDLSDVRIKFSSVESLFGGLVGG